MSNQKILQIEKVRKYYDSTVIDYKTFWTGSKDLAMHFGYYGNKIKTHQEALIKLNSVLCSLAKVSKKDRVLDAGCGYGGSSIWLGKTIGCHVTGITVVPYQIKQARKFAKKHEVDHKVNFQYEDYAHTSFLDNSFTIIWGLESIVHAKSKKDFVHEAFRLLKRKGRIIISEYMLREKPALTKKEQSFIDPWLKGWVMPSLLTPGNYNSLLNEAGFKNIRTHNITEQVRPSLNRLDRVVTVGFPIAKILYRLKLINSERYGNGEASFYATKALKLGLWSYTVIVAEKS